MGEFDYISPALGLGRLGVYYNMKQDGVGPFRRYSAEFLGTFFLVIAVEMALAEGHGAAASLGIGVLLVALTYVFAHISGAHFNPAITIAVYLRGKMHTGDVLPYVLAQFLGSTLATLLAGFFLQALAHPPLPATEVPVVPALLAECFGALLLVIAYINMFLTYRTAGNTFFGLVMGLTYAGCLAMFVPISAGAFNPAVALGLVMAEFVSWSSIWIFALANFLGGVLAAFLAQYINGPEG